MEREAPERGAEIQAVEEPGEAEEAEEQEPDAEPLPTSLQLRVASPEELADWDDHAVRSPHGHVYQSRAWGEYRAAHGWQPWYLTFDDGFRVLVVAKDHPVIGGSWAYATRGPIPEQQAELGAMRAAAIADLLGANGVDAFTVDGEAPARSGLRRHLANRGFEPTEELQPSRHRMDVRLGPDDDYNSDERTIFASFGATTRNNIRQAERHGLRVKRLDAGGGRADDDYGVSTLEGFEDVDPADVDTTDRMLRAFYSMLDATAHRRGFALASQDAFLDWTKRGLLAGHVVYLQAEHDTDGPVAGAAFYRHGTRLTYALAGDRAALRKAHPGAVRLLVWRGIQIALDERRRSVDLGGVDTEGDRSKPDKGHPNYGMYQFKESFGARWIELTGAHQRTMHPMRHGVGRMAAAALRRLGRLRR
jgi:lipid II:glycine glycyltransferase (peptidoglycan interpeptide bridge formation enzyme)